MPQNCYIMIIGTEILSGHVIDTNSHFLAQQLIQKGIELRQIITIHDDKDEIKNELNRLVTCADVILITGGLGPTWDDGTSASLAYAFGVNYQLNPQALSMVKQRYIELFAQKAIASAEITPHREKMAWLPENASPIPNTVGTAPGIKIEYKNANRQGIIYVMPGVPKEMEVMFQQSIAPNLKSDNFYFHTELKVIGFGESILAPIIEQIHQHFPDIYVKSMPNITRLNEIRVILETRQKTFNHAKELVEKAKEEFLKLTTAKS